MVAVRWTPQAADDLQAIVEFIEADSPQYARLLAADIIQAVERLADFPESGRMAPESRRREIREIRQGNYRIIYRLTVGAVEILTVYHGARLLDPKRLD